jgi:branched-chain amino acid aminotransferase
VNGEFVPESEAKISIWDAGFQVGHTIFETERTFKHQVFELDAHLERLWRSAKYAGIDPGMSKIELKSVVQQVLEKNLPLIAADDDYWVYQHITGGVFNFFHAPELESSKATVIVNCFPITFQHYAAYYREGAHLVTSSIRMPPPICQDPKMKSRSRMVYHLADLQAKQTDPDAYCLLLDVEGNLAENRGANVFVVKDERLFTPTTRNVLDGISRSVVMQLARELGYSVTEKDLQLYDAYTADEVFLTSTSFCILPIARIDHVKIGASLPGGITQRLLAAWSGKVGMDIVEQACRRARATSSTAGKR